MDPLTMGAIGAGVGLLGSMFTDSPEWKDVSFEGVDAGRYGFQGVYQKFLQSEQQKMKDDESRRIMKLATNLVPGTSSLRGGLASQGLGGTTSNIIAKQQREQAMAKALDVGMSATETSFGNLNQQFLNLTGQNEQMYNQATQFNAEGKLKADITNSQGQFAADSGQSQKWQDMFGGITKMGTGILGQEMGMQSYNTLFNKKKPLDDILSFGDVNKPTGFLNGTNTPGQSKYDWLFPPEVTYPEGR
jgi:hypothetical protein